MDTNTVTTPNIDSHYMVGGHQTYAADAGAAECSAHRLVLRRWTSFYKISK